MKTRERASAVCVAQGKLLMVRLRDPQSGVERVFPPGGAIESGETPAEAACRETIEETGFIVRALPCATHLARYPYLWNGETFDVTTHFVAVELEGPFREPVKVIDAPYLLGAEWMPLPEALEALSFDMSIRQGVASILEEMASL